MTQESSADTCTVEDSDLTKNESSFDSTEYHKILEFLHEENTKKTEYFSLNAIGGWNESDFGDHFFGQP